MGYRPQPGLKPARGHPTGGEAARAKRRDQAEEDNRNKRTLRDSGQTTGEEAATEREVVVIVAASVVVGIAILLLVMAAVFVSKNRASKKQQPQLHAPTSADTSVFNTCPTISLNVNFDTQLRTGSNATRALEFHSCKTNLSTGDDVATTSFLDDSSWTPYSDVTSTDTSSLVGESDRRVKRSKPAAGQQQQQQQQQQQEMLGHQLQVNAKRRVVMPAQHRLPDDRSISRQDASSSTSVFTISSCVAQSDLSQLLYLVESSGSTTTGVRDSHAAANMNHRDGSCRPDELLSAVTLTNVEEENSLRSTERTKQTKQLLKQKWQATPTITVTFIPRALESTERVETDRRKLSRTSPEALTDKHASARRSSSAPCLTMNTRQSVADTDFPIARLSLTRAWSMQEELLHNSNSEGGLRAWRAYDRAALATSASYTATHRLLLPAARGTSTRQTVSEYESIVEHSCSDSEYNDSSTQRTGGATIALHSAPIHSLTALERQHRVKSAKST